MDTEDDSQSPVFDVDDGHPKNSDHDDGGGETSSDPSNPRRLASARYIITTKRWIRDKFAEFFEEDVKEQKEEDEEGESIEADEEEEDDENDKSSQDSSDDDEEDEKDLQTFLVAPSTERIPGDDGQSSGSASSAGQTVHDYEEMVDPNIFFRPGEEAIIKQWVLQQLPVASVKAAMGPFANFPKFMVENLGVRSQLRLLPIPVSDYSSPVVDSTRYKSEWTQDAVNVIVATAKEKEEEFWRRKGFPLIRRYIKTPWQPTDNDMFEAQESRMDFDKLLQKHFSTDLLGTKVANSLSWVPQNNAAIKYINTHPDMIKMGLQYRFVNDKRLWLPDFNVYLLCNQLIVKTDAYIQHLTQLGGVEEEKLRYYRNSRAILNNQLLISIAIGESSINIPRKEEMEKRRLRSSVSRTFDSAMQLRINTLKTNLEVLLEKYTDMWLQKLASHPVSMTKSTQWSELTKAADKLNSELEGVQEVQQHTRLHENQDRRDIAKKQKLATIEQQLQELLDYDVNQLTKGDVIFNNTSNLIVNLAHRVREKLIDLGADRGSIPVLEFVEPDIEDVAAFRGLYPYHKDHGSSSGATTSTHTPLIHDDNDSDESSDEEFEEDENLEEDSLEFDENAFESGDEDMVDAEVFQLKDVDLNTEEKQYIMMVQSYLPINIVSILGPMATAACCRKIIKAGLSNIETETDRMKSLSSTPPGLPQPPQQGSLTQAEFDNKVLEYDRRVAELKELFRKKQEKRMKKAQERCYNFLPEIVEAIFEQVTLPHPDDNGGQLKTQPDDTYPPIVRSVFGHSCNWLRIGCCLMTEANIMRAVGDIFGMNPDSRHSLMGPQITMVHDTLELHTNYLINKNVRHKLKGASGILPKDLRMRVTSMKNNSHLYGFKYVITNLLSKAFSISTTKINRKSQLQEIDAKWARMVVDFCLLNIYDFISLYGFVPPDDTPAKGMNLDKLCKSIFHQMLSGKGLKGAIKEDIFKPNAYNGKTLAWSSKYGLKHLRPNKEKAPDVLGTSLNGDTPLAHCCREMDDEGEVAVNKWQSGEGGRDPDVLKLYTMTKSYCAPLARLMRLLRRVDDDFITRGSVWTVENRLVLANSLATALETEPITLVEMASITSGSVNNGRAIELKTAYSIMEATGTVSSPSLRSLLVMESVVNVFGTWCLRFMSAATGVDIYPQLSPYPWQHPGWNQLFKLAYDSIKSNMMPALVGALEGVKIVGARLKSEGLARLLHRHMVQKIPLFIPAGGSARNIIAAFTTHIDAILDSAIMACKMESPTINPQTWKWLNQSVSADFMVHVCYEALYSLMRNDDESHSEAIGPSSPQRGSKQPAITHLAIYKYSRQVDLIRRNLPRKVSWMAPVPELVQEMPDEKQLHTYLMLEDLARQLDRLAAQGDFEEGFPLVARMRSALPVERSQLVKLVSDPEAFKLSRVSRSALLTNMLLNNEGKKIFDDIVWGIINLKRVEESRTTSEFNLENTRRTPTVQSKLLNRIGLKTVQGRVAKTDPHLNKGLFNPPYTLTQKGYRLLVGLPLVATLAEKNSFQMRMMLFGTDNAISFREHV